MKSIFNINYPQFYENFQLKGPWRGKVILLFYMQKRGIYVMAPCFDLRLLKTIR